jgi:hypothetical protein
MILSNVEIHRALDERRLVIEPEPSSRFPTANAADDCPYQTSSVDLRPANEISYFRKGLPLDINLSRGGFARLSGPMSESVKISEGQPFVLRPNHLVLGRTLERVETANRGRRTIAGGAGRGEEFVRAVRAARSLHRADDSLGICRVDYAGIDQPWAVQYLAVSGRADSPVERQNGAGDAISKRQSVSRAGAAGRRIVVRR